MKPKLVVSALAVAVATATVPATVSAQQQTDPNAKATFVGKIKRTSKSKATLKVTYQCSGGAALWVSAKQSASGKKDARLTKEGSSKVASAWLQSHRGKFTCDGTSRTATFTIDKVEKGSKGKLKKGTAYVQFCVSKGEEEIVLYKTGWVTVA
ncbi:hypothetical protein [Conexibacter sp. SYSU D00693]|uniref:hypothetical protein n=1 Tax=Conexibacter sp. SYSU D00693 TaxID=2812560 RepID=UPI00196B7B3D|nr:hypothetical protein [Conexibacter sp. SYSU D00693]